MRKKSRDFSEIGDYSFSNMKTVLTIAGSDSSGGAGIQADIKTLTVHKVYAMTCITALTAQNTVGITEIMPVPAEFFKKQMESIFTDCFKGTGRDYRRIHGKIFYQKCSGRPGDDFDKRYGFSRRNNEKDII